MNSASGWKRRNGSSWSDAVGVRRMFPRRSAIMTRDAVWRLSGKGWRRKLRTWPRRYAGVCWRAAGMGAVHCEADFCRIASGLYDEVVLELALRTVVDQIDARIDSLHGRRRIGRDADMPVLGIRAVHVIHVTRKRVAGCERGVAVAADDAHPHHILAGGVGRELLALAQLRRGKRVMEGKGGGVGLEEDGIAAAARDKLDPGVGLSTIGFEAERQLAVRIGGFLAKGGSESERSGQQSRGAEAEEGLHHGALAKR